MTIEKHRHYQTYATVSHVFFIVFPDCMPLRESLRIARHSELLDRNKQSQGIQKYSLFLLLVLNVHGNLF